jgi:hypothetical protein
MLLVLHMCSSSFFKILSLCVVLALGGAGCFHQSSHPTDEVPIPVGFPDDLLRFPGAHTYEATYKNSLPVLGQTTASTTPEIAEWLNKNYQLTHRYLHAFQDLGNVKVYAFQDEANRYTVRLEMQSDSSTTRLITDRMPLMQAPN